MGIYLNGSRIATHLFNQPHNTGATTAFIGKSIHPGYEDYMRGSLDDLRIYNRALSDTEIKSLYQQGQPKPTKVVLFLHGMNSNPGTWNDMVSQYFAGGNCPSIYNGKINATAKANAQNTFCYRVKFGAFDADSTHKGLEDAWDYGETNGYASAGDYSTFNELGQEVNQAVSTIKNTLPNANILLVAHSRGGLAARAFLQNPMYSENQASVGGLITTGTPHNGSRLGRIYKYVNDILLDADGGRIASADAPEDWQVVDFLNGTKGVAGFQLDARRPVISYLADNNPEIAELALYQNNMPAIKSGAIAYTNVGLGDLAKLYKLFAPDDLLFPTLTFTAKAYLADGGDSVLSKTAQYVF